MVITELGSPDKKKPPAPTARTIATTGKSPKCRLLDAGAIMLGKTNVSEFGYSGVGHNSVFPTTRNPWNTNLTPGGSSAGSGAAVASGMGPITIGSDGGGSVRIPSSFSGLYGLSRRSRNQTSNTMASPPQVR